MPNSQNFINTEILNGDIISRNWYHHIIKKDGYANYPTIILYGYIVNKIIKNNNSYGDEITINYREITDNINMSKSCAEDALKFLIENDYIYSELRTITVRDKKYNNVRFVKLNGDSYVL